MYIAILIGVFFFVGSFCVIMSMIFDSEEPIEPMIPEPKNQFSRPMISDNLFDNGSIYVENL
jgi:hypothetical protein